MSKTTKKAAKPRPTGNAAVNNTAARKSKPGRGAKSNPGKKKGKSGKRWPVINFLLKLGAVFALLLVVWCIHLDATVRAKFEGKRWQLPAQVYARPLELYPGAKVSKTTFLNEMKLLGYARTSGNPDQPGSYKTGSYFSGKQWVAVNSREFRFADATQAGQAFKVDFSNDNATDAEVLRIVSASGEELSWVRLEPLRIGGIYPAVKEDRTLVNLSQVPATLVQTLVQIEDRDFYQHQGVSLRSVARAFVANIRAGRIVQGGSTLTQQLVKNFYLDQQQTLWRKFNEALMAMLLELHYDKPDILEAYLNEIFLGQAGPRAIHGIGLASHFYFGKSVEKLAPEESALLVAIIKGASYYNPRRNPQRAIKRRNLVLSEMAVAGIITPAEHKSLAQRSLGIIAKPRASASAYPGFMELVKAQLARDYREEDLQTEGLQIFTTLDPAIQRKAEQALTSTLTDKSKQRKNKGLQGALISTSVGSGEILALVGGKDPRFAGFNRALSADRQIGSLIKPFVYLTALSDPGKYTLATILEDETFRIKFDNGDSWQPRNFDGKARGPVIMQQALTQSLNLSTVRLGLQLKVESVLDTLRKMGADLDIPPYPSVLLGAVNMTPVEVAEIYQNLVSGGFRVPLRAIRAVTRPDGELLSRYSFETEQVLDSAVAYIGQFALYDVMHRGTGKRFYQYFPEDYLVGGKTGTTDGSRDSWFAGFNGDMLTTVWLGKDDNQPTTLTGGSGALEVWIRLYKQLPQTSFTPLAPAGIEWAWVDEQTGKRTAENCAGAIALPFVQGSVPTEKVPCANQGNFLQRWLRNWWSD